MDVCSMCLGETIDNGEEIDKDAEHWVIHRQAPTFEEQSPAVEILGDRYQSHRPSWHHMQKVVRLVCSVVPELVRPY